MNALEPGRGRAQSASQMTTVCISVAVCLFVATIIGLPTLGRPSDLLRDLQLFDARLDRLEARAHRLDRAFAYPQSALCAGSPDAAAHSTQVALSALTVRTKLAAASSTISLASAHARLQPLDVTLDGNGDYAAAISTLRGLADVRPVLLLDRVDLLSKGTYLHLHVTGRSYCWSPAQP